MFDGKNIFFEKSHYNHNENNGAEQTQQNYTNANRMRKQLIQKEILWNNEQKKN